MKAFSADIIFPISLSPIENGVVVTDDHGKILDILDPKKTEIPSSLTVEKHRGFICPGFVNAHCHLELSHFKGKFTQKKGLPYFIGEMVEKRTADTSEGNDIMIRMREADAEMYSEGIVAVGDISNNSASIGIKEKSKIAYHTFVELFDIFPERAKKVFDDGKKLKTDFESAGLQASIVPHAPYTVTNELMKLISENAARDESNLCIHNQESDSENEMFEKGSGMLIEKLRQMTGAFSTWKPTGMSSLKSFLKNMDKKNSLQLVHNTYSDTDDIQWANNIHQNLFWCLCVNANLFIEDTMPDIEMLRREKCRITIGTDSYASNTSLSIIDELKKISWTFEKIELSELLRWATLNGAAFLRMENEFGSIDKGKTPGLNLISVIDLEKIRIKSESKVERLI